MTVPMHTEHLTPTEDLILNVLIARYRLGERSWTFESRLLQSLKRMEDRGIITYKSASVQHAYLVWLTYAAETEFITKSTYRSPVSQENEDLKKQVATLKQILREG